MRASVIARYAGSGLGDRTLARRPITRGMTMGAEPKTRAQMARRLRAPGVASASDLLETSAVAHRRRTALFPPMLNIPLNCTAHEGVARHSRQRPAAAPAPSPRRPGVLLRAGWPRVHCQTATEAPARWQPRHPGAARAAARREGALRGVCALQRSCGLPADAWAGPPCAAGQQSGSWVAERATWRDRCRLGWGQAGSRAEWECTSRRTQAWPGQAGAPVQVWMDCCVWSLALLGATPCPVLRWG